MTVTYQWRGDFANDAVNALHAECFDHALLNDDWNLLTETHSLGWVCAREGDDLVGFVNVAWDGLVHAFVIDTMVTARARRRGVGRELVGVAVAEARVAGCEWLHVDFDADLSGFYFRSVRLHSDRRRPDRPVDAVPARTARRARISVPAQHRQNPPRCGASTNR